MKDISKVLKNKIITHEELSEEEVKCFLEYVIYKGTAKALDGATTLAPKVAAKATAIAPYILGTAIVAIAGWSYYKAGEYFANMVNDLNGMFNSKNFWANLGGFNYDGSDW